MDLYNAEYSKLNDKQKEAVDYIEGPLLVVAGPGTGKTQLLSMRVANILKETDSDANNILCLTFTNKAAINMRERLQQLIGSSSRNVVVRTFHSFAADIMNQYPDYFWKGARLSVAPDAVQTEIIQEILASLPLSNPLASTFAGTYTALEGVKQALKLAKEGGITPPELRIIIKQNLKYIDKIESRLCDILSPSLNIKRLQELQNSVDKLPQQKLDFASFLLPLNTVISESLSLTIEQDLPTGKTKNTGNWKTRWVQTIEGKKGMYKERKRNDWWLAIAYVYESYRNRLHERGYYDYSDMLIEVLEQLKSEPDMKADLQERFTYVLIDEFQDTNAAQLQLAHLISDHYSANNRPNLMAVGDDDQSIFAFNGAELNNMLNFKRSYTDTKLIVLKDNYRSSQTILDTATKIIDQASDRLVNREPEISKELIARQTPEGKSYARHISRPTRQHQFVGLAKEIEKLWNAGETDIAVLARKHESLRQISAILHERNIPITYDQQSNVLEHEAVRVICLIARLVVAIADGDMYLTNSYLAELVRHPMWDISDNILWKLATDNYSSPDWLNSLLDNEDNKLTSIGKWLVWLARISNEQPLPLVLEYLIGLQQGEYILSPFREYYVSLKPLNNSYLETLSAIELLRGLAQEFTNKGTTLSDFVRFIELNLSTKRVIADESWFMSGDNAVQLLTVYKAKGLEFEHVFVVDAIESMWKPRSGGRSSPANLRLQSYGEKDDDYVRLLYVAASRAKRTLTASSYLNDEQGNQLLPTPLLSDFEHIVIDEPIEDSEEVLTENLRWPKLETDIEKNLLKDRLDRYSISPTALIDFLNIVEAGPESFKERHLLRLPRPRSPLGGYGTAIHAALETAQRLINTTNLVTGTVLDRFESALADEHMSPLDYERFKVRGLDLLQNIISNNKIKFNKGALSEQRITDITLGEARINGKLDLIYQSKGETIVSDYKTGKPLSSFETKDKTKQVKAWRHKTQLIFYCLLIQQTARFKNSSKTQAQMIYVEAEKDSQIVLELYPKQSELERMGQVIESVWEHIMSLNFPDTSQYDSSISGIEQFISDLIEKKI